MKRFTCFTILFFSAACCAFSQTADTGENDHKLHFQNQVGIDATNFIKAFIAISTTNPATTPNVPVFMANYKALFSNRLLPAKFRYGIRLGGSIANNTTDNSTETTFNNTSVKSNAWRVGIEIQQEITNHWVLYYGIDYLRSKIDNTVDTKAQTNVFPTPPEPVFLITNTETVTKRSGFGPMLGIQFNINKHICLSTEASLYFLTGSASTETFRTRSDGGDVGAATPPSATSIKQQTIALPAFINFSFMF